MKGNSNAKILAAGLALCVGLTVWGADAQQLLTPPPQRPDALVKAVTSEVTAVLKHDLASATD